MVTKYKFIKVYAESKDELDKRLKKINEEDLRKMGVVKRRIPQIEFTKFLFKNSVFISDAELRKMTQRRLKLRKC